MHQCSSTWQWNVVWLVITITRFRTSSRFGTKPSQNLCYWFEMTMYQVREDFRALKIRSVYVWHLQLPHCGNWGRFWKCRKLCHRRKMPAKGGWIPRQLPGHYDALCGDNFVWMWTAHNCQTAVTSCMRPPWGSVSLYYIDNVVYHMIDR